VNWDGIVAKRHPHVDEHLNAQGIRSGWIVWPELRLVLPSAKIPPPLTVPSPAGEALTVTVYSTIRLATRVVFPWLLQRFLKIATGLRVGSPRNGD
jgi:hypothetical protein